MKRDRLHARRRRQLPVLFGGRVSARTVDLSPAGFCAEMASVFLPGSRVDGTIEVRGRNIRFSGEVIWASAGHPQADVLSRVGVRFLHTPTGLFSLART